MQSKPNMGKVCQNRHKGEKMLFVQLKKALYGCVRSVLLWYDLFLSTLMELGFKLSPYDACIENAIINGNQFTICWYADDSKLSHANASGVMDMIQKIESKLVN